MNLCVVSEYTCTFEDFEAVVKESEEEVSKFVSDFELVKVVPRQRQLDSLR